MSRRRPGMPSRSGRPRQTAASFYARAWRDVSTGCLRWSGAKNRQGYGQVRWNMRMWRAHCLSWCLANGVEKVPKGLIVCHALECPNKDCIDPDHLRADTHLSNYLDTVKKGTNRWHQK